MPKQVFQERNHIMAAFDLKKFMFRDIIVKKVIGSLTFHLDHIVGKNHRYAWNFVDIVKRN
ncbi:hypothetical protein [Methanobacterium ferruginis]|uniref:hypothetical protein n=1 Tax=Methanobacterium ferruginis TaxID=710191 RepID=UPI002573B27E|nr:hypothetical protein [Methanobacterium ferruginis]